MRFFAVGIQSNFIKVVAVQTPNESYMSLEDVTAVVATTHGLSEEDVIKKVASNHEIPEEMLVAFELMMNPVIDQPIVPIVELESY